MTTFFINLKKTREFTGNFGVYNFIKNNNYAIIKKYVSDHLLIFSEYSTFGRFGLIKDREIEERK